MSIQVTAFLNPFSQKKSEFHFEEAISIQEIIKKIDALHAVNTGWRVLIDDEIVTDFTRIPKNGQHVYIKLVPEGDNQSTGTGMKVGGALAVVGGITAIAFLGWTGIGGAAGAALIGIGIGCFMGGTVLYNLNIEVPSLSQNKKQQAPEQDPAIRGSENQLRPYGMIPTLFGKRRIYSDLAATSYTWAEDGAIYLYQLFCAGQKNMEIDTGSIKIDETLITQYSSTGDINKILSGQDPLIDMRIHQDGTMPLLYNKCVHEEQINAILKHETEEGIDGSVIRTTPEGTQEINVDLFFFNGLGKYNNNGGLETTSVEVGAWYKRSDEPDSAYKLLRNPIPAQNKTQFFHVSLPWGIQVTRSTLFAYMADWSYLSGDRFDVDPAKAPEYQVQILSVSDPCPSARSIIPPAQIVDFSIGFSVSGSTNIVIEGAELKTKRYSITKLGLSPASYTVKISRLTADGTDMNVIDDVYVGSIRAAKNVNPIRPERAAQLTLVELKIKASAKLNNVVKKLNFVAQSKLPSYLGDGSGSPRWSDRLSSNPASAAIYAMQGGFAQQQLSDGEIDWPMFERLYIWCAANGYECNAYLTEQIPISSLLSSIASTCRAEIFRLNGKITAIQDITRDSFTQLFTPRNSHGYSEQIALATIPDALSLSFVDKQNGYAENFTRVYNTPSGNYAGEPHTTQEIQLWGVTDSKQARKIGMYDYAVSKHRFIIHKFSCDFEYLMCSKGDWIKYAGDIAIAGVTQGRITERIFDGNGLVAGFECDEIIPMKSGKSYGMRVRKANGESELFYLVNTGSSSRSVYLQNPIIVQNIPQNNESKAGDLFTFGEVSGANLKDAIDLIVTDIQCGENLSADLTCVEYAPEIFGVDEPNFVLPEFENNLSEKSFVIDMGDVSEWRTFTTYNDSKEKPSRPEGDGTQDGWHYVQTENSFWISTKTASTVSDGVWSEPMPSGQLAFERLLSGDTDIGTPDSVAGLTAIAREKDILITWNPASEDGLKNTIKYYSVEISRDGGEHWSNAADTNKDSLTYPFDRKIVGYPESDEVSTWFVRARAVNVYGNASETWSVTAVNTSSYGTWIPAASNFTMKEADEGGINLAWSIARGIGGKELYGSTTYRIIVKYEDEIRAIIETDSRVAVYNFNRSLDHFPEKPDVAGAAVTLDKFKVSVEVINESGNTALGTDKFIDYDNYKTWIPRLLEGEYAVRQNAAKRAVTLLFPPQDESIYGSVVFGITISRRNTDKDGNMQIFYTPNITKDCYSDINSYKDTSTNAVFCSSSFKQNLPLIGQDMRTIQLDRYDVEWRDGEPVKDSAENIERYAISREYYVYDSDGIQSFRSVYGVHSAINLDSILESLENNMTVTDYTWTREGGSDSNYTVCHMTLSLIQTPMPEDTEYIYKCFAKNTRTGDVSPSVDINILATAGSAADMVDKAITANKLDDQSVTTEKIAAGAITAEEIAAVNLLAKGATAGNMTAEGLQVPESGFWAGKTMRYDFTDPEGIERTYTAEAGEFFVGNNPAHEESPTENDEYLHFIPRTKQFFLAIKNIVFQSLATIVKGVFRVKNSIADSDSDSFLTVNPTGSTNGGTPARTMRIKGRLETTDEVNVGGSFSLVSADNTDGALKVINADNVEAGAVFSVMKDGSVLAKGTVSSPNFSGSLSGTAANANKLNAAGMSENGFSYEQTSDNFQGASGWAHYLISNYGNGESYYNFILRLPFLGIPQYQRQTGNTNSRSGWFNFITQENIGAQSVTNAKSAIFGIAYCNTSPGNPNKTAYLPGFSPTNGARILMYNAAQSDAGASTSLTLNVNNTGAKPMSVEGGVRGLVMLEYQDNNWYGTILVNLSTYKQFNYFADNSQLGFGAVGALGVRTWRFADDYGYIAFENGLLIQWGQAVLSNSSAPLIFPIAFSTAPVVVATLRNGGSFNPYAVELQIQSTSQTQAIIMAGSTMGLYSTPVFMWFAIGKGQNL